jgi:hypothetical protein
MTRTHPAAALALSFALALSLSACVARRHPLDSAAVLDRVEVAQSVEVKHVLIGWKWLDVTYRKAGMALDERAQSRTEAVAEEVTRQVFERLLAGEKIEALMREVSEDPGSAQSGIAYPVTANARLVADFIDLALRLKPGEAGIVKSQWGFHVMQRVK